MATESSPIQETRSVWLNALLLTLVLAAFARTTLTLDRQDLWWDESLSLQRAESGLIPLLTNEIVLSDGLTQVVTTDQHPFFYFLLQAVLVRMAGIDEFTLRFVSSAAAALMVPAAFAFASLFVRRRVFASSTPSWAALLATVSPFLLWYGQEARPYALWALLAMVSTYTLLRSTEDSSSGDIQWSWVAGYCFTLLAFVTTHYYAVLLLPIHAMLVFLALRKRWPKSALVLAIAILVAGLALITFAYWYIIVRQGGGANFSHVSWKILLPDVLNAYSLGLSVDISQVFYLYGLFALVALAGAIYALRSKSIWKAGGWIPVAMVVLPVGGIMAADQVHPVYMNARHLSLIAGPYVVLMAAGIGLIWLKWRWVAVTLAVTMAAASIFSTHNYFTQEVYAKDDYSRLGHELDDRITGEDLVLVKSPFAWRIFSYYLPAATMNGMPGDNQEVTVYGVPLLDRSWEETEEFLDEATDGHQRVWLLVSGTHPYMDPDNEVEAWLDENLFKLQETTYFSHSSLKAHQYLADVPVSDSIPDSISNPTAVEFGDQFVLHGYDVKNSPDTSLALPYTLYWEALQPTDRRYKYVLRLIEQMDDGSQVVLAQTEREPYSGAIPTIYWDPGKVIVEFGELPPVDYQQITADTHVNRLMLTLEMYDAETLEKLPVTKSDGAEPGPGDEYALLPFAPE